MADAEPTGPGEASLVALLHRLDAFQTGVPEARLKAWKSEAIASLGRSGPECERFARQLEAIDITAAYRGGVDSRKECLKSALRQARGVVELALAAGAATPPTRRTATLLSRVVSVCGRLGPVERSLAERDRGRPPFLVEDEYDLQDLLRAMLLVAFDDVRREEFVPSLAGSPSRVDFLVRAEAACVAIEAKMTRDSMQHRDLVNQLSAAIARYAKVPSCAGLVLLVFDPQGRVKNPAGFRKELEEVSRELPVCIVIHSPRSGSGGGHEWRADRS